MEAVLICPAAFIARAGGKSTERCTTWSAMVRAHRLIIPTQKGKCDVAAHETDGTTTRLDHTPDKLNDAAGGETGKAAKGIAVLHRECGTCRVYPNFFESD
jgi:hypothetical protein